MRSITNTTQPNAATRDTVLLSPEDNAVIALQDLCAGEYLGGLSSPLSSSVPRDLCLEVTRLHWLGFGRGRTWSAMDRSSGRPNTTLCRATMCMRKTLVWALISLIRVASGAQTKSEELGFDGVEFVP